MAGFLRGPVDRLLMMLNDALLAFPSLLLALGLIAVFGASSATIIFALALAYFPAVVRVVRASVLSLREREYVAVAPWLGVVPGVCIAAACTGCESRERCEVGPKRGAHAPAR